MFIHLYYSSQLKYKCCEDTYSIQNYNGLLEWLRPFKFLFSCKEYLFTYLQ